MADKQATWAIKIPTETNADTSADKVDELRNSITAGKDAIRQYVNALSNLRGKSDEVKSARERLKAEIEASRAAVTRNQLALLKEDDAFRRSSKSAKEAGDAQKRFTGEMSKFLGPIGEGIEKTHGFSVGQLAMFAGATLAVEGVKALAEGLEKVGEAAVEATIDITKFILESADGLRSLGLQREASNQSAENARAFGTQIDYIRQKVPLGLDALNDLSNGLAKTFSGTRLNGQGIVDLFEGMSQAAGALGDQASKKLEEILSRGKQFGRVGIGRFELQGTGLDFDTISASLAERMHISVAQARQELVYGYVGINDAAAAIKDAMNKQFGDINTRKMLSLGAMSQRLKDNLRSLTEGLNLTPILTPLSKMVDLFSQTTVQGQEIKTIITGFGALFGEQFKGSGNIVRDFVDKLINVTLRVELWALKSRKSLRAWTDHLKQDFAEVMPSTTASVELLQDSFRALGASVTFAADALVKVVHLTRDLIAVYDKLNGTVDASSGVGMGIEAARSIITGTTGGIARGGPDVRAAGADLGAEAQDGFNYELEIHSPSKKFERGGRMVGVGAARGIETSAPLVQSAARKIAPSPAVLGAASGKPSSPRPSSRTAANVTVNVAFPNVHDGAGAAKELSGPTFRASIQRFFDDLNQNNGT